MKIIKIIIASFLMLSIGFTCFFGVHKISNKNSITDTETYKGVLTLWQIDSFEGGVGSRKQFLLKIARSFEKKHNGILIMVINLTKEGAEENFRNGIYPDMISYGNGVDIKNVSKLNVYNKVKGGLVGDEIYATAWCRGGYALISKQNDTSKSEVVDELIVSQCEYTQPLTALNLENIEAKNIEILPPMEAYVKFVSSKGKHFLGTQRDVNRLQSRAVDVEVYPLSVYNDLYQYISITTQDSLRRYYCEEFINYLLTESSQKELKNIGMLSCFYQIEHENEHLSSMQCVKNECTVSAFIPSKNLKAMQELSLHAFDGNAEAKEKIKNMLV